MATFAQFAAAVLAVSLGAPPHAPLANAGDHVTLKYDYVGHVTPDGEPTKLTGTLSLDESNNGHIRVAIANEGRTRDFQAAIASNGDVNALDKPSDLLTLYNTIPRVVHGNDGKRTSWSAQIPVKVSETEWRDIPVHVTVARHGASTVFVVTGNATNIVIAHGFTVGEDAAVNGRVSYSSGQMQSAHFNVNETVHTYTDIPIAYEWTMSR